MTPGVKLGREVGRGMLSRMKQFALKWGRYSLLQKMEPSQRCGKQSTAVFQGENTREVSDVLWEPLLYECNCFPPIIGHIPSVSVVWITEAMVPRGVQAVAELAL